MSELALGDVTVRDATPSDQRVLATILGPRWGEIVVSRGRLHRLAALPALIAERARSVVGCVTYCADDDSLEVVTLDALEARRGIGTALMRVIRSRASRVWLVTTNDNLPARAFYEKLGMRLVAVHAGAIARSRELKPGIPQLGPGGVPITDEIEYAWPRDEARRGARADTWPS